MGMTVQELTRQALGKLGWDPDCDKEQYYYLLDLLAVPRENLAQALSLLRATSSVIGTIEDDDHWKAQRAAEEFLAEMEKRK